MASEKIDALELDINAKLDTANLDKLIDKLGELDKALNKLKSKTVTVNIKETGEASKTASEGVDKLTTSFANQAIKITALIAVYRQLSSIISDGIADSMTYIKTLNMFNVSLGSYADNATKYGETVREAMGIDIAGWQKAQGIFETLIKGFGVGGDQAAYMSQQLTQLSYDIASYYDLTTEEAQNKVKAAISGRIEPIRKLGWDISQGKLVDIASNPENYGIMTYAVDEETGALIANTQAVDDNTEHKIVNFNQLTQQEKVQLRYIALMTHVAEVQGNMGKTLRDPATQMKVFKEQITMTGRALGNIFIPAINEVLPYLTAFFNVLEDGFQEIARFFGYEIPDMSDRMGIEDEVDYYDDVVEATGSAAKNAKKLKDYMIGIDELNVLRPDDGTSGGGGTSGEQTDLTGLITPGYDFLSSAIENRIKEAKDQIAGFFEYYSGLTFPEIVIELGKGAGLVGQGFWEWALGKTPEELAHEAAVNGRSIGEEFWYALMHNPHGYGVDLFTWITGKTPEQLKAEAEANGSTIGLTFASSLGKSLTIPGLTPGGLFSYFFIGSVEKSGIEERAKTAGRTLGEQFTLEFGKSILEIFNSNPFLQELYRIATNSDPEKDLKQLEKALKQAERTNKNHYTKTEVDTSSVTKAGANYSKAYADGIESGADEVERAAKKVYEKAFNGATNNGNGSRWFYNASAYESSRYVDGIRSGTSLAASAGQALYDSAFNGVSKGGAASTSFSNAGYYASSAYNNGLLSNMRDVLASGGKLFEYAYNGANNNGNAANEFSVIADNLATLFANALGSENAKNKAYNAGSSLSKKGAEGAKAYKSDYSYVATELATAFADSMASTSMLNKVYKAAAELSNEGTWGAISYLDDYEYAGEMAGQGFINGMREWVDDAGRMGSSLGGAALEGLADAIRQGSPSKETHESGMWFSIGFAKGIEEYTKSATEAASRLAELSLQATNSFITDRQISVPANNMGYGIGAMNEGAMASLASNIFQAVVSGMSAYGGDNDKETTIVIDGKEIFKVVQSEARKRGAEISNGAFSR